MHRLLNECCSLKHMNLEQTANDDADGFDDIHGIKEDRVHHIASISSRKTRDIRNIGAERKHEMDENRSLLNQSLGAAVINYSMMSEDVSVADDDRRIKRNINFTSRSFSRLDSPLRTKKDALGIINEPNDIQLLREREFVQPFKDLGASIHHQPSTLFLILETTFMIASCLLVSFMTESVMVLWGFMGSTVGFLIAFTLPGFFYLKLRAHKGCTKRNGGALCIAVSSCFAMVLCTWQSVKRLNADSCPRPPAQ